MGCPCVPPDPKSPPSIGTPCLVPAGPSCIPTSPAEGTVPLCCVWTLPQRQARTLPCHSWAQEGKGKKTVNEDLMR